MSIRLEESLIRLEILSELELLKYVATRHRTQYVSTEKLRNARVDRAALKLVKKATAKTHEVFPLILDRKNDKLVVATADPDNILAAEDLKLATQVGTVVFVVVRPRAIHAAIARGYERDKKPFARLIQELAAQRAADLIETGRKEQRQRFVPRAKQRTTDLGHQEGGQRSPPPPSSRRGKPTSSRELPLRHSDSDAPPAPQPGAPAEPRLEGVNLRGVEPGKGRAAPKRAPALAEAEDGGLRGHGSAEHRGPRRAVELPPPSSNYEAVSGPLPQPHASRFANEKVHGTWQQQLRANHGVDERNQPAESRGLDPSAPEPRRQRSTSASASRDPSDTSPSFAHPPGQVPRNSRAQAGPSVRVVAAPDDAPVEGAAAEARTPKPAPSRRAQTQASKEHGQEEHRPLSIRGPNSLIPNSRYGLTVATPRSAASSKQSAEGFSEADILGSSAFTELLRLTANLLDNQRAQLAGHSAHVARLVASACQRIRLSAAQTQAAVLAAFLHDIGKASGDHLTALAVSESEALRRSAEQLYMAPLQLMATVAWPQLTLNAIAAMYECFDGSGLPKGLARNDIPLSARILAVADSFADLTRNQDNVRGRLLSTREALEVLRGKANTIFDPHIVDLFASANESEQILSELGADRYRVLVVDPDPDQTMLLQLRFIDQGFDVRIARDKADALLALQAQDFHCVLCEVDLDQEDQGLELRAVLRKQRPEMAWVFLTSRSSGKTARQAFDLDVDDVISKPLSPDIVVAKVVQIIERRQEKLEKKGVSGSLAQMSLADVVQIMWHGRKTCALIVVSEGRRGEVHFSDGSIVHAVFAGVTGKDAFYRLLAIGDNGDFSVDPDFAPFERSIDVSPDALLLEGMRLLDEGKIP